MTLIDDFAAEILARSRRDLPLAVAHETRRCLLNVLGTAIGASRYDEISRLVAVGARLGGAEVAPPARREVLDRYWSACVIGSAAHFDDYDDTHLETVIHPGAATLAAGYPLSLLRGSSGSRTLTACALGVESQLRVGLAMTPSHYGLGWHITGTCGVIGAAVTAGLLVDLDERKLAAAIGLAANMTLGHREGFGTMVKPFHAGKAAANGVLAAELAAQGLPSSPACLDGPGGFFSALSDEWVPSLLENRSDGCDWALLDNSYKPYPCGIVAHPAIEAATNLHPELDGSTPESIVAVWVRCNPLVVELMGRPTASTGLEARFCAVHGVAVGLLEGTAGLEQFSDEHAVAPLVERLRSRTRLLPTESLSRSSAEVTVKLANGAVVTSKVTVAAGSRERPLSDAQLFAKFAALTEPVLPGRSAELAEIVELLGATTSVVDIARVSRPA